MESHTCTTANGKAEDPLALLHLAASESKNGNRYLWLRDHCTHADTLELLALVQKNKHAKARAQIIDDAVDAKIAALLVTRATNCCTANS